MPANPALVKPPDPKRGTGRTTRLLEHARERAHEGRPVYVIADNQRHARLLQEIVDRHPDGNRGIKVETPDNLRGLDWQRLELRGAFPSCVVLVDHYAIEQRFGKLFEELHRYDKPNGPALKMDGFDDCIIGTVERCGMEPIVCYDREAVIRKLVASGIETLEEAHEFYEFNQLGAWMGNGTPCFLTRSKATPDIRSCLKEAIDLMEGVRSGDYVPDSVTTQQWRHALENDPHEPLLKWVLKQRDDKDLEWNLMMGHRSVATVWSNGAWHTWDSEGVGGENDKETTVKKAKVEAAASAIAQGFV